MDDVEHVFQRRPGKVTRLEKGGATSRIQAGYRDLDVNEHVNSARYLEWILEDFNPAFLKGHRLREMEANYMVEALYGDRLSARCETAPDQTFLHSLARDADGLEVFRARTRWEPTR